jgi:glycosyltransferase involved in cell wall biosynthesis
MQLDVLIATFNRADLLPHALESLLEAEKPEALELHVTVIDNRSTDDTRAVVESFASRFAGRLHYLYERKPGKSYALNAGIAATSGELVGMIDDDERVDRTWLQTIATAFADPATDFVGGPYRPLWGAQRPIWLGRAYGSAIGWTESGHGKQQFGPPCELMLMGGNAVIRRSVLERVGPYATDVGRTPGRLLSCEDEDMFARLIAAGARGFYRPDLVIHHYVPPERLTKRYFRRWCFWRGVSRAVLDRRRPAPVRYLLGVPRYMVGLAVRGTIDTVRSLGRGAKPAQTFANELAWWDLAGFVYGKYSYYLERSVNRVIHRGQPRGSAASNHAN